MCVCLGVCVCAHARLGGCMHTLPCLCLLLCSCACVCPSMYVWCVHVCTYVDLNTCVCVFVCVTAKASL